jgi:hypothetical protein
MLALLRFLCCPIVGRLALSIVRSLVANKTPRLSLTDRITHARETDGRRSGGPCGDRRAVPGSFWHNRGFTGHGELTTPARVSASLCSVDGVLFGEPTLCNQERLA